MAKSWLTTEEHILKRLYSTATLEEVQSALPMRSLTSIHHKAARLGLDRSHFKGVRPGGKSRIERAQELWKELQNAPDPVSVLGKYRLSKKGDR